MLRFGTDGIRGDADEQLTSELVVALGRAAARVFGVGAPFLIGRDTRESGPRIAIDLAAGLVAEGASVEFLGVVPTPAVAFCSQRRAAPAAMISASHNRWTDNGIKLFAPGGLKLDDDQQAEVERVLDASVGEPIDAAATPAGSDLAACLDDFEIHLRGALEGRALAGLNVVLDCANGSASAVAPELFASLGATVQSLACEPDGRNINEACGSNHPEALRRAVVAAHADLGLAFDGDADRCVAVDASGALVDGDQVMVAMALDMAERGALVGDTVVVTVMSNLGLRLALAEHGIAVCETPVGDRHILAALEANGFTLGGEQSGHVIFRELATTGDGVLTGLLLADLVVRSGRPLRDLAAAMTRLPQVLENVRVAPGFDLAASASVWAAVRAAEAQLGDLGRVLVRASGTEPLVRVMAEAPSDAAARAAVDLVKAALPVSG